jgi:ribokinase
MDFIAYLDRFPEPGETVIGRGFISAPGGKGANQAVAASRLGATCYFVSKVGSDFVGEGLLDNARRNGISTDYVKRDSRSHSGVAVIYVNAKGENMIAVAPGVDRLISESDIEDARDAISSSYLVLTQLEMPVRAAEYAMEFGKGMGKRTLLNPAPASELSVEVLRYVDIMTPNRGELAKLTGTEVTDDRTTVSAAERLIGDGVGSVIVTLGKRGAMIVTSSEHELIPSYEVKAIDTVGAGDAFNGALALAISVGCSSREAVRFANMIAALKVTRRGAQEGLPTMREARDFAQSLRVEDIPTLLSME